MGFLLYCFYVCWCFIVRFLNDFHFQDALLKITRTEGVTALWRGLPPTLLMAVPATVIYFVGYESIRTSLEHHYQVTQWAPLISGGLARSKPYLNVSFDSYSIIVFFLFPAISASIISPIELIRTRLQSGQFEGSRRYPIVLKDLSHMVRQQGALALWKGLSPTLWRDVPFSGRHVLGWGVAFSLFFYLNEISHSKHSVFSDLLDEL